MGGSGAQAARLSLRMQRELQMLRSDPPPGVSLCLPDQSSALNSLSVIDAEMEGPQESAYREGLFHIRIQIPDRYPLHPPVVTFKTPIYHPNIDEGGRICLDILNLPPKGAWQPSLNISAVLMSIGLLLSEPNPDDGLVHEASRDYKYNRQAFDQKARFWTEKYAKATTIRDVVEPNAPPASNFPEQTQEDECKENQGVKGHAPKLSLSSSRQEDRFVKHSKQWQAQAGQFNANQMQVMLNSKDGKVEVPTKKGDMPGALQFVDSNVNDEKGEQLCSMIIVSDSDSEEEEDLRPTSKLRLSLDRSRPR